MKWVRQKDTWDQVCSRLDDSEVCVRMIPLMDILVNVLAFLYAHGSIQHIICNVLTNFLPCSHTVNPNNETCLVTYATWLMYTQLFL